MKKKRAVTNREDSTNEKLRIAREYARLQRIRMTMGNTDTKPKVTLPRFSWDKGGE